MFDEELRAAREERRVTVFIQILCDELKSRELFSGEGQLQSFGDITSLQGDMKDSDEVLVYSSHKGFAQVEYMLRCCPLVERWKLDLVIKCDSSVHVRAFLLVVTGSFHHVLWVTEQSQVHQLVIQSVFLVRHKTQTVQQKT